ncbi:hypothetical protein M6B38_117830 [Iris pallida]|uniref:Uncharacterized protein n=1 Tax=Iris pallida TaxID=29817 RepID=A0AAX6HIW9_IRIPA|nr:hypothetical protein M6B38_117830 [Iris pallida]
MNQESRRVPFFKRQHLVGETDDMLYTSYYSPADEATKDDLVQEVEPTADLEI